MVVHAACGTWLPGTSLYSSDDRIVNTSHDLSTKEDCWSDCVVESECNAVAWKASDTTCWLLKVPEVQEGTVNSAFESYRACEPGVDLLYQR